MVISSMWILLNPFTYWINHKLNIFCFQMAAIPAQSGQYIKSTSQQQVNTPGACQELRRVKNFCPFVQTKLMEYIEES